MNTIKRIFAVLFALVLAFTAVPFSVEAEALTFTEVESTFTIVFNPGSGYGSSDTSGALPLATKYTLPSAASFNFKKTGYYFDCWEIEGAYYAAGDTYVFDKSDATLRDDQYFIYATAQWTDDEDNKTNTSGGKGITVTFTAGEGNGKKFTEKYTQEYTGYPGYFIVTFPNAPKTYKHYEEGYSFQGWKIQGESGTYKPGDQVAVDDDFDAIAQWKKGAGTTGVTVKDPNSNSSSKEEDSSSSSSSSKPVSSAPSSSAPSSSKPASSAPSSSKPTSSKPASSSSSSSVPESSSESSSAPESSVPEVEEPEVFNPVSLAYSISGDIPVTGIEFLLKEDIGENPQLRVMAIDSNSATDAATEAFIANGDALAAFDLSLLVDGLAYHDASLGTVNYILNGTQNDAESRFDSYVLAIAHVTNISDYDGEYYITDGENTYAYTPETNFRSAVANVVLVEEDGVNRLVIRDASGLSSFAYQATENVIVEVNLVSSSSLASIDVAGLSPVLLVQLEVGDGSSAGFAIPFWVWIIIGVVVLLIVVLVVLYLINRNNEQKRYEEMRRHSVHSSTASTITGFDEE